MDLGGVWLTTYTQWTLKAVIVFGMAVIKVYWYQFCE